MGTEKTNEDLRIRGAPNRCPYCRDAIGDLKEVVACASCGARHHEACHTEHGACSSCGSADVLVARSRTRQAREEPPQGSSIEVRKLPTGGVEYSWPGFTGQHLMLWFVLLACTLIGLPLFLWALLVYLRGQKSRLVLRDDRLEITRVGLTGATTHSASRQDVGAIRLGRIGQQGMLRASVDIGVNRIPLGIVGGMVSLKEPEIEWLHQALQAWKEG